MCETPPVGAVKIKITQEGDNKCENGILLDYFLYFLLSAKKSKSKVKVTHR